LSVLTWCNCKIDQYNLVTQDKESWDLNNEEKIEAAGKKKEEGNALFKLGKYARASKRYEKVLHRSFCSSNSYNENAIFQYCRVFPTLADFCFNPRPPSTLSMKVHSVKMRRSNPSN